MLVFEEREKPEYPEKNLSEQDKKIKIKIKIKIYLYSKLWSLLGS